MTWLVTDVGGSAAGTWQVSTLDGAVGALEGTWQITDITGTATAGTGTWRVTGIDGTVDVAKPTGAFWRWTGSKLEQQAGFLWTGATLVPLDTVVPVPGAIEDPLAGAVGLSRSGKQLLNNGTPVRLAGTNYYDAVITDAGSTPGNLSLTTQSWMIATLDQIQAAGHNTVRCHTLFINYGKTGTARPTLSSWNETVLVQADRFLAECESRGLWVVAPLVDSWDYYHGGAITFSRIATGAATLDDFVIPGGVTELAFKAYITTMMNRVSTVTGKRWADHRCLTVLETANEAWQSPFVTVPTGQTKNWHGRMAAWLKSQWPSKLVADGFACSGGHLPAHSLGNQDFDILGTHLYTDRRNDISWVTADAALAAAQNQCYFVGEYDWRDVATSAGAIQNTGTTRQAFLTSILNNTNVTGSAWWAARVTAQGTNNGGYELRLDAPTTADETSAKAQISAYNAAMLGTVTTTPDTYRDTYSDTY